VRAFCAAARGGVSRFVFFGVASSLLRCGGRGLLLLSRSAQRLTDALGVSAIGVSDCCVTGDSGCVQRAMLYHCITHRPSLNTMRFGASTAATRVMRIVRCGGALAASAAPLDVSADLARFTAGCGASVAAGAVVVAARLTARRVLLATLPLLVGTGALVACCFAAWRSANRCMYCCRFNSFESAGAAAEFAVDEVVAATTDGTAAVVCDRAALVVTALRVLADTRVSVGLNGDGDLTDRNDELLAVLDETPAPISTSSPLDASVSSMRCGVRVALDDTRALASNVRALFTCSNDTSTSCSLSTVSRELLLFSCADHIHRRETCGSG
jgi:hypothetical protein